MRLHTYDAITLVIVDYPDSTDMFVTEVSYGDLPYTGTDLGLYAQGLVKKLLERGDISALWNECRVIMPDTDSDDEPYKVTALLYRGSNGEIELSDTKKEYY